MNRIVQCEQCGSHFDLSAVRWESHICDRCVTNNARDQGVSP